ncbi:hypothetical protein [Acaryochloris sp. IP29b_bin.137]|uniref:hypothetical protein n=1 Tax=Acaryochloris sp. IP29b_bin.137 TaxID=2969217 RepID=UPI0026188EE7|nr:hypothetical protein [Acaryochloris sp. IP29b_bin.137]
MIEKTVTLHYFNSTIVHPSHPITEDMSIYDFLNLANGLSNIVKVFLGANVTANYLRESKPEYAYLANFEIDRNCERGDVQETNTALF